MIALDTNVLVRLLVEDDVKQGRKVVALLKKCLDKKESIYISHLVLCETVWVLKSAYRFSRIEIAKALHLLLHAKGVEVQEKDMARSALSSFQKYKGDFSDYLLCELVIAHGGSRVATFDKLLLDHSLFFSPED